MALQQPFAECECQHLLNELMAARWEVYAITILQWRSGALPTTGHAHGRCSAYAGDQLSRHRKLGQLANQQTFQLTITGQKRLQAITNHFAVSGILTGSLLGFYHVGDELQTQIFFKLILFNLVSGQSAFHKVPLQLVTQMHSQTRPKLDVRRKWARIDIMTFQSIT